MSWHGKPDYIVLVKLFVRLHEVEYPLLEVVKHATLHCMEEVGHREVAYHTGNMSNEVQSSVVRA